MILGDQLWVEARLAVARHVDRQLAGVGHYRLPTVAVAHVAGAVFASEVVIHLRIQGTLCQRLLQRIEQTALLEGGAGSAARQKLIEKLIRYSRLFASRHSGTPFLPIMPAHTRKS